MRDYADLIKTLRRYGAWEQHSKDAADAIEELLAAVPKRGEWITTRTWEHDGELYCSICGFEQSFARFQKFKYCPRCGAKMEVAE